MSGSHRRHRTGPVARRPAVALLLGLARLLDGPPASPAAVDDGPGFVDPPEALGPGVGIEGSVGGAVWNGSVFIPTSLAQGVGHPWGVIGLTGELVERTHGLGSSLRVYRVRGASSL